MDKQDGRDGELTLAEIAKDAKRSGFAGTEISCRSGGEAPMAPIRNEE